MQTGSHGKQLAEGDFGFSRIIEREGFGQIFFRENFLIESIGEEIAFLMQHDAAGNARERLANRGHGGDGFAIAAAIIFLINQPAMAHYEQPAVLAGARGVFKRPIKLLSVHTRDLKDLGGILKRAPAALAVRRGKIIIAGGADERREKNDQAGDRQTQVHSG